MIILEERFPLRLGWGETGHRQVGKDPPPSLSKAIDKMAHWARHAVNKPLAKEQRVAAL